MVKTRPGGVLLSGRDRRTGTENQLETFLNSGEPLSLTRFAGGRSCGVSIFCSLSETPDRPSRLGFRVYVRYPTDTSVERRSAQVNIGAASR